MPNKGSSGFRGGRFMTSPSSGFRFENDGTGRVDDQFEKQDMDGIRAIGPPRSTGAIDIPAIGTCTATI